MGVGAAFAARPHSANQKKGVDSVTGTQAKQAAYPDDAMFLAKWGFHRTWNIALDGDFVRPPSVFYAILVTLHATLRHTTQ